MLFANQEILGQTDMNEQRLLQAPSPTLPILPEVIYRFEDVVSGIIDNRKCDNRDDGFGFSEDD